MLSLNKMLRVNLKKTLQIKIQRSTNLQYVTQHNSEVFKSTQEWWAG